ncbi:tetratricopeptide repeat protein [Streptomyces niveus]|uniref:tetratricopeptide repeat protein n=1 Tax=Streptomyces niveus TaxID=193462 RepID=UPI0036A83807
MLETPEAVLDALRENNDRPYNLHRTVTAEELVDAAEQFEEPELLVTALLELMSAYEYTGEHRKAPVVFARVLKLRDDSPDAFSDWEANQVLWRFKWVTTSLLQVPEVPLAAIRGWTDQMRDRYREAGHGMQPVAAMRHRIAAHVGSEEAERSAYDLWVTRPREGMSDCEACETRHRAIHHVGTGDARRALDIWQPVFDGGQTCAEEPYVSQAHALLPLLSLGRVDEARSHHLSGYRYARGKTGLAEEVGLHVEFSALSRNEGRGLEILAENRALFETTGAPLSLLGFLTGVEVLLTRLVADGYGTTTVAGPLGRSWTARSLLAHVSGEADTLAAAFDARNGTTGVGDRRRERLARPALLAEPLPLGLRTTRPDTVPAPPVSSRDIPDDFRELVTRAREMAAVGHPGDTALWERIAERVAAEDHVHAPELGPEARLRAELVEQRGFTAYENENWAEANAAMTEAADLFAGEAALPWHALAARARVRSFEWGEAGDREAGGFPSWSVLDELLGEARELLGRGGGGVGAGAGGFGTGAGDPGTEGSVPGTGAGAPDTKAAAPATGAGGLGTKAGVPGTGAGAPDTKAAAPATGAGGPGTGDDTLDGPGTGVDTPDARAAVPATTDDTPPTGENVPEKYLTVLHCRAFAAHAEAAAEAPDVSAPTRARFDAAMDAVVSEAARFGMPHLAVGVRRYTADLASRAGRADDAATELRTAVELLETSGRPWRAPRLEAQLGQILLQQDKPEEATAALRQALAGAARFDDTTFPVAFTHLLLGHASSHAGDLPGAVRHLSEAAARFDRESDHNAAAEARLQLADVLGRSGQPADAVAVLESLVLVDASATVDERLLAQIRLNLARGLRELEEHQASAEQFVQLAETVAAWEDRTTYTLVTAESAIALARADRWDAARAAYERALLAHRDTRLPGQAGLICEMAREFAALTMAAEGPEGIETALARLAEADEIRGAAAAEDAEDLVHWYEAGATAYQRARALAAAERFPGALAEMERAITAYEDGGEQGETPRAEATRVAALIEANGLNSRQAAISRLDTAITRCEKAGIQHAAQILSALRTDLATQREG